MEWACLLSIPPRTSARRSVLEGARVLWRPDGVSVATSPAEYAAAHLRCSPMAGYSCRFACFHIAKGTPTRWGFKRPVREGSPAPYDKITVLISQGGEEEGNDNCFPTSDRRRTTSSRIDYWGLRSRYFGDRQMPSHSRVPLARGRRISISFSIRIIISIRIRIGININIGIVFCISGMSIVISIGMGLAIWLALVSVLVSIFILILVLFFVLTLIWVLVI